MAEALLGRVAQDTRLRRIRLNVDHDQNEWSWDTPELPVERELLRHAQEMARVVGVDVDTVERIAGRLLGPWHKPAVLEAFGCLIPREFHPRYDNKKPKGKVAADEIQSGVIVDAGGWQVDIFEEQVLSGMGGSSTARLSKAVLEFFLIVLRRMCARLNLPLAIGCLLYTSPSPRDS